MELREFFEQNDKVAIAFSGGVDSAYLLYEATRYAKQVRAYYVKSAFQPEFEFEDAKRFAKEQGIELQILDVDVLADEEIVSNSAKRCYYCKKQIMRAIINAAKKDDFHILLDGTNASDDADDRPGMKALVELEVLSPLRICGLTKSEIRARSKEANLFTWDKPAYACLATRIATGQRIHLEQLERTQRAEAYLMSLGFVDFRVRTNGNDAKIQIRESQLPLLLQYRNDITKKLKTDYQNVLLDLEVRSE